MNGTAPLSDADKMVADTMSRNGVYEEDLEKDVLSRLRSMTEEGQVIMDFSPFSGMIYWNMSGKI